MVPRLLGSFVATGFFGAFLLQPTTIPVSAQEHESNLAEFSLEELMGVEVRSVSKRDERLFDAPAAAYVLTSQDLRRSGVRTVGQALQLVPGLHAAPISAGQWSIGSRGFGQLFSDKLLVLVDGQSVYTRIFAGVMWEEESVPVSEIERIEVIRGPGATLWGANAVNGVINIVTKSGLDRSGVHAYARTGAHGESELGASQSGEAGSSLHYRIFGNYRGADGHGSETVPQLSDLTHRRFGARIGLDRGPRLWELSGDIYSGEHTNLRRSGSLEPPFRTDFASPWAFSGGNVMARLRQSFRGGSDLEFQAYYKLARRDAAELDGHENTFDLDLDHRFAIGEGHRLVWGLGYRRVEHDAVMTLGLESGPLDGVETIWSGFVQDEIEIAADRSYLTLGAKLEHNQDTGLEIQPKVSLVLRPTDHQTLWGAVSRAVRTPSLIDTNSLRALSEAFPNPQNPMLPVNVIYGTGNPNAESEELLAWEAGYRLRASATVSVEGAIFFNRYDNLRTFEIGEPSFDPQDGFVGIPTSVANLGEGTVYGAEILTRWEPIGGWILEGSYSHATLDLDTKPESTGSVRGRAEDTPEHVVRVRSAASLPADFEIDISIRYQTEVPGYDYPSATFMNGRLGWRPLRSLELAAGVRDLFAPDQPEVVPEYLLAPTTVPSGAYFSASIRF